MSLDPILLLLLTAFLFILVFGGLSLMRREGLSVQFAVETLVLTALLVGGTWLAGIGLSPIVLLIVLYVLTMRSRLLVDLAALLGRRGRYAAAFRLYRLGLAWWPDKSSRLIILANRGAAELRSGQVEAAIETLEGVLAPENQPNLGLRYEAASRYNLGWAFEKAGEDAKAVREYNEVLDLFPGSVFAQAAGAALKRRRKQDSGS
jgi:tetratricopeptide (TPR) repeat protein